jgi:hypothetical protein
MKVFIFCQNGLILGVLLNKNTYQNNYFDHPNQGTIPTSALPTYRIDQGLRTTNVLE